MFSTILKEVSGYFDRRALISAFFPSFVYWTITLSISIGLYRGGWSDAIVAWDKQSTTTQALLLIAFFTWIAFWSFLTLNFRPALIRLYEGYWPKTGLFAHLSRWRTDYWQKAWHERHERDQATEQYISCLVALRATLRSLLAMIDGDMPESAKQFETDFPAYLTELEITLKELTFPPGPDVDAAALSQRAGTWQAEISTALKACDGSKRSYLRPCRAKLDGLITHLEELLNEIKEQRVQLYQSFFLFFPPSRNDVMPTQLGNVLRAAELQVWQRYHLDPTLIWPRLQHSIPKEAAETLGDAKMSLDLMLTLSAFTFIFGYPLSLWLAFSLQDVPSLPLLLIVLLPLFLLIVFRLRLRYIILIAVVLLIANFVLPFVSIYLRITGQGNMLLPLLKGFWLVECLAVLLTGLWFISWVLYQNAVQASLGYAERLQTCFDLYRWKVLEELHLQLPPTLDEERRLWEELGGLLYRAVRPDLRYFQYVRQEQTKEQATPPFPATSLPVPAQPLRAYDPIKPQAIVAVEFPDAQIPADAVRSMTELSGRRPLRPLTAGQPISRAWLIEEKYLEDTVVVSIPAASATALAGDLQAGDFLDIVIIPPTNGTPAAPKVFENVLLLQVQAAPGEQPTAFTAAIPLAQRTEFAAALSGSFMLMRRTSAS